MSLPPLALGLGGEVLSLSILKLALVWPGQQRVDGAGRSVSFPAAVASEIREKDVLVGCLCALKVRQQGDELHHSESWSF